MSLISVQNLHIGYGRNIVLRNVTFTIDKPSFVVIVGPNGAGKTTLLRVLAGLLKPKTGQVKILGVDVSKRYPASTRSRIGYVPQRDSINYAVPVTVRDVIASGLIDKLTPPRTIMDSELEKRVFEIAEALGIEDLLDYYFSELSGGLQQRVLLARALVKDPELLLLDEPLSNVDERTRQDVLKLLRHLVDDHRRTVLLVTHDVNVAIKWADYVLLVSHGQVKMFRPELKEDVTELLSSYPEEDRRITPSRKPYCA